MDLASTAPSWLNWFCSAALQQLIPATLLITTPKHSILRYLAIPCLAWNAARFVRPVPGASPSWCNAMALMVVAAVQAINLLLIHPLDGDDLARENKPTNQNEKEGENAGRVSFPRRLYHAYQALAQNRAVNTPRQIKNVPAHPAHYARHGARIPRAHFLRRQLAILLWQMCFLDIFQTLGRQLEEKPSTGFAPVQWRIPVDQFVERTVTNLFTGVVLSRILIDAHYRVMSVVHVGLGLDEPRDWPPAFGRIGDAYTLRRYWGKFWHQFLRQPLADTSKFIVRRVLGFPADSWFGAYTVILTVFIMSGALHVMVDTTQAIPLEYSGAMAFFSSTMLGILIEEGVQGVWRKWSPRTSAETSPSLWMKTIGLAWVVMWMGVTSTWYFTPILQVPAETVTLVPFSMVENVDFVPVVGVLVALGLVLVVNYGVEI
ncbi:hypothetical protein N7492_001335 [Penicillium capsulatum]|uniref:Wax synthase domain-containing protein n=1 Tax=Penicillium capsulatum TaxID=69766 RepID=A0A9W9IRE5_9EURO|nr:hypothetical protein N7492_001335 [Penicillium capsulatum]KAJ6129606.1 hypothetical protein N7512_002386 [Penicillium capsulatum]